MADDEASLDVIFCGAIEIASTEERTAYIADACGTDAELRRHVERLVHAHFAAGSFLEVSSTAPIDSIAPARPAEGPGTLIGPYKLLDQIGEGGMGTVYMAEQDRPVRRKVALKVIKVGMDSRQVIARFEAERQALALMDHVNIARVLDAGTTDSGRPFFVMELVDGVPITRYCDDNRLTPRQRLELFVPVCQAIQHAHQKGIIHRDIKPSNVLVALHDGRPEPKLIDFGVAKAIEQRLTERTLFTQHGTLVGTLEYMSPEQAEMSALGVDTRSDIYSLGVLLYELLTGGTPLSQEQVRGAAYAEVLRMIREEEPPRPSTRLSGSGAALAAISAERHTEPARLAKLLRGELDWIVMKTLEKDRDRRYPTANAFAADVLRYLNDEPVLACPPSASYRFRKFLRRHRAPVLSGLALAALLVLGVLGTSIALAWALRAEDRATNAAAAETRQRRAAEAQRDQVVAERQRADEEAAIARAVNDFILNDLLAEAAPDRNPRDRKVTVEGVLDRAATRVGDRFKDQPKVEAAIRQTIGEAYRKLGNLDAAQPHLERALDLRRRTLGAAHAETLESMHDLAWLHQSMGQLEKAESLAVRVLDDRRLLLGEEHPDTLASAGNLAVVYQKQGRLDEAEPLARKALEAGRRVQGEEHPDTLAALQNLAWLYQGQGRLTEAEPLYVSALDLRRRVLGPEHPRTLTTACNLASLYLAMAQHDKAIALCQATLESRRRVLGDEHTDTLNSMYDLAMIHYEMGAIEKAVPLYVQVAEVERRVLGADHPHTLTTLNALALLYRAQRRYIEAEPLAAAAYEGRRRALGDEHPQTLNSLNHLASLYMAEGKHREAEPLFRAAVEHTRRKEGDGTTPVARALGFLGFDLMLQEKYDEAEDPLRESLAIQERTRPDDWRTFFARSLLGDCLRAQKRYEEAGPLLISGYEGILEREGKLPRNERNRLTQALARVVGYYEIAGPPDQAAVWRRKLDANREADRKAASPDK